MKIGQTIDAMYIGFNSDMLTSSQVTDYLIRVVQPQLQSVPGVQTAELIGGKTFALRAWLDPVKLAAYGLTATELSAALHGNDYIAGLGSTKGQMVQVNAHRLDLAALAARSSAISSSSRSNGANVKLRDVANVTLGSEDYESAVAFDGKKAVYIGIQVAPTANLLDVDQRRAQDVYPDISRRCRSGLNSEIVYDTTDFVNSSIDEVIHTLIEALLIVTARRVHVPRLLALGGDSDRRHSAVAHRHLHHSAGARLLDQSADAAGAGAGDRPRRRRRHHRRRERQSPSRAKA